MKILVLGNGFIGNKIKDYFNCDISSRKILSIVDIESELDKYNPDVVINCIGKTGRPNIDWCEDNKEETFFSNVTVPLMIEYVCENKYIRMVHIGSGCVYNDGIFTEKDFPNFTGSFYSLTKIIIERSLNPNVLQLRIRMPIDSCHNERNYLSKILKYTNIIDVKNSITYIPSMLEALNKLIILKSTGIYNVVNPDPISPVEIRFIYNKLSEIKIPFNEITAEELDTITKAKRSNCVLSIDKLREIGISMESMSNIIFDCVKKYIEAENLCKV